VFKRVIIKISGEALKGKGKYGIDPSTVKSIANEIKDIHSLGVNVGVVVGGGNLWRGKTGEELGMDRAQADYMGMLGTIMNGLALQDSLESIDVPSRVMTVLPVSAVAEPYLRRRALRHFEKNRVLIFSGGTGTPFFSTDTAAALRGAELNADIILMAKNNVDGVFDRDPLSNENAKMFKKISQKELMIKNLEVMDQTAASICQENKIDLIVFNLNKEGNMKKAVQGLEIGTRVTWEG
jgi:uridylate kinase